MTELSTRASGVIAENVKQLREARGLTQGQAAKLAHMPRATWTHLESGLANPTLAVLMKVSDALSMRIEDLLTPTAQPVRRVRASQLAHKLVGKAKVRALLPESIAGLEINRVALPVGERIGGVPHTEGSRAYFACEKGHVELIAEGSRIALEAGDVAVFRGDRRHQIVNTGRDEAIGFCIFAATVRYCPFEEHPAANANQ